MADDAGRLNQVFAETAFLYGGNADFIEDMYGRWAANPGSVPAGWRAFFEQLGVGTRLSAYGLDGSTIPAMIAKLEEHGGTALGEHQDVRLEDSRRILEAAR